MGNIGLTQEDSNLRHSHQIRVTGIVVTCMFVFVLDAAGAKPSVQRVPHKVRVYLKIGLSVEKKAAVVKKLLGDNPGSKNESASTNPKSDFRHIFLAKTMTVDAAIKKFAGVDGVARVEALILKPGTYAPGELGIGFEKEITKVQRDKIIHTIKGISIKREINFINTVYIKLPKGMTVVDGMRTYAYLPGVRFVEVNATIRANAS